MSIVAKCYIIVSFSANLRNMKLIQCFPLGALERIQLGGVKKHVKTDARVKGDEKLVSAAFPLQKT